MTKNEILSSAMAQEEIDKLNARKNEIASTMQEKREAFDKSDVETRDALLNEVDALQKEADEIDEQVKELEQVRTKFEEQEERMKMVKNVDKVKIDTRNVLANDKFDTPEYREAFVNYIKTNEKSEELRALTTGMDNVPVPTIFQGYVETAWDKYGKFSKLVNKTSIAALLDIPFESEAGDASIHTEGTDGPDEEQISLGLISIKPAMIKKWISLTDELMAMAADDFLKYVADELVYRVVLKLDNGIISGAVDTNGKGVVGIVGNANTLSYSKELSFNVVNEVLANLVTFDNITVAMNPATFYNNFMGLKDLQDRPIYQIAVDNAGKPQYFINGQRVEFTNALPAYDLANPGDVWCVVGDFRGYRLNMPEGEMVRTLVDPYTLAVDDKVRMIGRLYAGGNVAKLRHFAEIKIPASV